MHSSDKLSEPSNYDTTVNTVCCCKNNENYYEYTFTVFEYTNRLNDKLILNEIQ